jgi:hypothetical protein
MAILSVRNPSKAYSSHALFDELFIGGRAFFLNYCQLLASKCQIGGYRSRGLFKLRSTRSRRIGCPRKQQPVFTERLAASSIVVPNLRWLFRLRLSRLRPPPPRSR